MRRFAQILRTVADEILHLALQVEGHLPPLPEVCGLCTQPTTSDPVEAHPAYSPYRVCPKCRKEVLCGALNKA